MNAARRTRPRSFSLLALALFLPSLAHAGARVSSEFSLEVPDAFLDQAIAGSQGLLKGTQSFQVNDAVVPAGIAQVQVSRLSLNLGYSFSSPQRTQPSQREWALKSKTLQATVAVGRMLIQLRQLTEIGGIVLDNDLSIECRDVKLALPAEAGATIEALVRLQVSQNKLAFTLPAFHLQWPAGAWKVEELNCPKLGDIPAVVREKLLGFLLGSEQFEEPLKLAIQTRLAGLTDAANKGLMSSAELPGKEPARKVSYSVATAKDEPGRGIQLEGQLTVDYPKVARDQSSEHKLGAASPTSAQAQKPQLRLPFSALRALAKAEQAAGLLQFSLKSGEIDGFGDLMGSRTRQLLAWPDLLRFSKNTEFLARFRAIGVPVIAKERPGSRGEIKMDLEVPASAQLFAPIDRKWFPYVEMRTALKASASFRLQKNGIVKYTLDPKAQPVSYGFSREYVDRYHPYPKIAAKKIVGAVLESLPGKEYQLTIPALTLGQKKLSASQWSLSAGSGAERDLTIDLDIQ